MKYFIQQNNTDHLIVLFHGTGGNELQMLPIAGELFPGTDVISFAGEHAQNRYFPPLTNSVMDRKAFNNSIAEFIAQWDELNLKYDKVTLLGYSNGANFIIGLLEKKFPATAVVLLHPSDLGYDLSAVDAETKITVTAGKYDAIAPIESIRQLEQQFKAVYRKVNFFLFDAGHELSRMEMDMLKSITLQ